MGEHTELPVVLPVVVPASSHLRSCNFYVVKNKGSVMLVDAGVNTKTSWQKLDECLSQNNLNINDIDKIVLTHSHADHTGLVNRIRSLIDVPVYAHDKAIPRLKRDEQFLQSRIVFFEKLYREAGCGSAGVKQVDKLKKAAVENREQKVNGDIITVNEGDMLDGFQMVGLQGHAEDQIGLFHKDNGLFFAGDHLIAHLSSNALIEPDQKGNMLSSVQQYESSLKKLLRYELTTVFPGHGDIIQDAHPLVDKRLKRIRKKSEKMRKLVVQKSPVTAASLAQIMYQNRYESLFPLVMSEVIGQLDRLEAYGKIKRKYMAGKWYFTGV
ncbi:MBL fold metallo-hydrolase [Virgibacillus sp. W0181]|uniref:MBL fold metallo-hydrolase n=1 Tax=Virgibacillus sp. W0181 TaxID=3391581 RepID=UPI003F48B42A